MKYFVPKNRTDKIMMQLLFLGPFPFTWSQFHKIGLGMSGLTSSPPASNIYIYRIYSTRSTYFWNIFNWDTSTKCYDALHGIFEAFHVTEAFLPQKYFGIIWQTLILDIFICLFTVHNMIKLSLYYDNYNLNSSCHNPSKC